jgi:hypothetical protein
VAFANYLSFSLWLGTAAPGSMEHAGKTVYRIAQQSPPAAPSDRIAESDAQVMEAQPGGELNRPAEKASNRKNMVTEAGFQSKLLILSTLH